MRTLAQEFRTVGVNEIEPHERNVNQGDLGAIYESIEHNGFFGALIVQASTGKILCGTHRWKAAIEAGRLAYRAGRMPRRMGADPSSPLAGLIR